MDSHNTGTMDILLTSHLHDPASRSYAVVPGFLHRLNLCKVWAIPVGSRLLDIGCGQGESSLVLATIVGPNGHVTGVDPGPPDYGAPYTLGQSQAHILASPLGQRISFKNADPTALLQRPDISGQRLDAAVLCHSLWYFASAALVADLFAGLAAAGVPRIYFAEWRGTATRPDQEAHAVAARAQKVLHAARPIGRDGGLLEQNVRSAMLPEEILGAAQKAGWKIADRGMVGAPDGMMDGHWEAQYVASEAFAQSIKREVCEELARKDLEEDMRTVKEFLAKRGAVKQATPCMNIVWAILERGE